MKRRNGVGLLIVLLLLIALVVGGGFWAWSAFKNAMEPRLSAGCTAVAGESRQWLATDQTQNAALISTIAVQRGMPPRAASIALATAMQESRLRNIDYGDLDSVGLFQQRPSQDWGSVEQIMDPVYSTNAFYDVLAQVPDYTTLPINDAAQIVQRSGFPHAYAQHEPLARAFASALTGQSPAALSCTLPAVEATGNVDALASEAQAALGPLGLATASSVVGDTGTTVTLEIPQQHGWMMAHWAVANAASLNISSVTYAGQVWDRNKNADGQNVGWQASESASDAQISVFLPTVESPT